MSGFSRRPFSEFFTEQESSNNFKSQVKKMSEFYSFYRDVQADGNCMYRSVALILVSYYFSPFTPMSELELFYKRIRWQELPIYKDEYEGLIPHYIVVVKALWGLIELRQQNDPKLAQTVENVLNSKDFMDSFIYVLRNISMESIITFKLEGYYDGCEEDMLETMAFGKLSGDLDLLGLSNGLNINCVQVTMGRNDYQVGLSLYKSTRDEAAGKFVATVALVAGHFYAFYPKGLETLEGQPVTPETQAKYQSFVTFIPEI